MTEIVLLAALALSALGALRLLAKPARPLDLRDPADQLTAVRRAGFAPRPIMNAAEFRRFCWMEEWARGRPYRLFTQVSYGEVIRSDDREAHASINSKRADFVLVDADGLPAAVIEYQGTGHYRGNAKARDAVKRAALQKAGVPMIELFPTQKRSDVLRVIEAALGD